MELAKKLKRHQGNPLTESISPGEKEASGEERRNLPKAEKELTEANFRCLLMVPDLLDVNHTSMLILHPVKPSSFSI
jgi:hypothetical protein